ncbi:hypothetical protein Hanom_Chr12g01125491 [Helianthus anomalus]
MTPVGSVRTRVHFRSYLGSGTQSASVQVWVLLQSDSVRCSGQTWS